MFGYLFVKKEEYKSLKNENSKLKDQLKLEKEDHETTKETVNRLCNEISGKTSECNVGPWCQDCQHKKFAQIGKVKKNSWGIAAYCDGTYYCGKHTHDLCPEWEASPKKY